MLPETSAARTQPARRWRRLLSTVVRLLLLVTAGAMAGGMHGARAQTEPPSEYQVKAAFLYNFVKFVEWPVDTFADPGAPFVLGVLGEDPFGSVLEQTLKGKTVNGRALVIRGVKQGKDLRTCHILFVSSSEIRHLDQILESLKGSSVLTVGEMERFAQSGGAVNFVLEQNRVRFEINPEAAARARLRISSKLLALARIVADERREGKS